MKVQQTARAKKRTDEALSEAFGPKLNFFLLSIPVAMKGPVFTVNLFFYVKDIEAATTIKTKLFANFPSDTIGTEEKTLTFFAKQTEPVMLAQLNGTAPIEVVCIYEELSRDDVVHPTQMTKTVISDLRAFLADEELKDVTFNIDGKPLTAHKLIMSARSPVFKRMFTVDMKEQQDNKVVIEDISYEAFAALLEFIYTDECANLSKFAEELLNAAEKYEVSNLKFKAGNELLKWITPANALNTLILFDRFRMEDQLKKDVMKYIKLKKDQVFSSAASRVFLESNKDLERELFAFMLFN